MSSDSFLFYRLGTEVLRDYTGSGEVQWHLKSHGHFEADGGFEPRTSASQAWAAALQNKPHPGFPIHCFSLRGPTAC